jgi:peptidoglycan hydrolase-like protein with peptidoglycan-binding domain
LTAQPHLLTTLAATLALTLAAAASSVAAAAPAGASPAPVGGVAAFGNDISWPQCARGQGGYGLPGPMPGATFAVLGLNGGGSFYPNPCLARQVAAARGRHLWTGAYAIMTYPSGRQLAWYGGAGTAATRLARVGRLEAAYNLANMHRAGLRSPMVWVDAEPVDGAPWSANAAANNAVIDGVITGYKAGGVRVGIYSYGNAWKAITGGRALPKVPTWVPVGHKGQAVAGATCALVSYAASKPWLTQWTDGVRDYDRTCPGITGKAAKGNHLTPYLNSVLAIGSRGGAVAVLQRHLGGLIPDGAFGALTRARVVAFQRSRHLQANGIITSVVWRSLGAGGPYTPARGSMMGTLFAST